MRSTTCAPTTARRWPRGSLPETTITCPWHSAEFDVTTGEVLCPPASENARSYPVFVNGKRSRSRSEPGAPHEP